MSAYGAWRSQMGGYCTKAAPGLCLKSQACVGLIPMLPSPPPHRGPIWHSAGALDLPAERLGGQNATAWTQPPRHTCWKTPVVHVSFFQWIICWKPFPGGGGEGAGEKNPQRFSKQRKLHFSAFSDSVAECRVTKFVKAQGPGITSNSVYFDRTPQSKPGSVSDLRTQN